MLGGLIFVVGIVSGTGAGIYVNYLWWKEIIENFSVGFLILGSIATSISLIIVVTIGNLVSMAGAGLFALGSRIYHGTERSD